MIGLGILGIGLILWLITTVFVVRLLPVLAQGNNTEGTVIRLVEDAEDHMFAPVIQFTTSNRTSYEFTHLIYQNPPYKIGEKVKVLYNRNNPNKAVLKTFSSMYLAPLILGILGCGFSAIGVFLFQLK